MLNYNGLKILLFFLVCSIKYSTFGQPQKSSIAYDHRLVNFNFANGPYSDAELVRDFGNGKYPDTRGFASIEDSVYKICFKKGEMVNNTGAAVQPTILPGLQYTLQYRIKYASNFQSGLKGKQFGFEIGVGYDGGRGEAARTNGNGGSVRLQFESKGDSIYNDLYVYSYDMLGKFGNNPGNQSYSMLRGIWHTIRMTVTMQSAVTEKDGRIEVWCNDKKCIDVGNVQFVREEVGRIISRLSFESFPGGGGVKPDYDNFLFVDDFHWYKGR